MATPPTTIMALPVTAGTPPVLVFEVPELEALLVSELVFVGALVDNAVSLPEVLVIDAAVFEVEVVNEPAVLEADVTIAAAPPVTVTGMNPISVPV